MIEDNEPTIKHFTKAEAIEFFGPGEVKVRSTNTKNVVEINGVLCKILGHKSKALKPPKTSSGLTLLTPAQARNQRRNARKKLTKR